MAVDPKLIPPSAYQGLPTGPRMTRFHEAQETVPIDGSNALLRQLSPFTIQIIPPAIYSLNQIKRQILKNPATQPILDIYDTASRQFDAFREHLNKRTDEGLQATTSQTSGRGRDFTNAEFYISNGKLQLPTLGSVQNPAINDLPAAMDIALQLEEIMNAPPLTLLINPQNLSIQFRKVQQFTERTRNGYIFQAWGQEQPVMSVSGKIGAFIAGLPPGSELPQGQNTPVATGVQFATKRDSASYQNLMNLFTFYRHNGYIYDTWGGSQAMHAVGVLSISYDNWVYFGNMNSFSFGFEDGENQNGGVAFDFEFTINKMRDIDRATAIVRPIKSPNNTNVFISTGGSAVANVLDVIEGDPSTTDEPRSIFGFGSPIEQQNVAPTPTGATTNVPTNLGGFIA